LTALRAASGEEALESLGWDEWLGALESDHEARLAVFGYLRAQGRRLASSGALGRLMAQPFRAVTGDGAETSVALEHRSRRKGTIYLILGDTASAPVLLHRSGVGLSRLDPGALSLRPISRSDGARLQRLDIEVEALPVLVPEAKAGEAARHSVMIGRIALAHELLGAAETALAVAVRHAKDRYQFGSPIGSFQAVRHLLAGARVDCAATESLADQAVELYPKVPAHHDAILKAVAGRNGLRTCRRTLQVLGGIGFTAEHDHHRFYSRVLTLDALLGSSAELAARLAGELRRSAGASPDLTWPAPAQV
jgi:Acyl-CoA dehydrogenase, C-terminal domain